MSGFSPPHSVRGGSVRPDGSPLPARAVTATACMEAGTVPRAAPPCVVSRAAPEGPATGRSTAERSTLMQPASAACTLPFPVTDDTAHFVAARSRPYIPFQSWRQRGGGGQVRRSGRQRAAPYTASPLVPAFATVSPDRLSARAVARRQPDSTSPSRSPMRSPSPWATEAPAFAHLPKGEARQMQLRHGQAVRLLPLVSLSVLPSILGLPADHDKSAADMRAELYKYMLDISACMLKDIYCFVQGFRAFAAAHRKCADGSTVYDRPASGDELVEYLRTRMRVAVEHAKLMRERRTAKGLRDKPNCNGSTVVRSVVRSASLASDKLRFPLQAALASPVVRQFTDTHKPERVNTGQSPSTCCPVSPPCCVVH